MAGEDKRPGALDVLAESMPSRAKKLKIWAVRSVIVVAAAYAVVAMNGPAWLIWAAWIYVALTLVLAFVLTRGKMG